MGIVESIGWLVIIFGVIYLILKSVDNKRTENKELQKLILNNDRCQELIRQQTKITFDKHGKFVKCDSPQIFDGDGKLIDSKIKDQLLNIINDPYEKNKSFEKIREIEQKDIERKLERRRMRKVGYKYEIDIFEIFIDKREMPVEQLLAATVSKYKIDILKAMEIVSLWEKNMLVNKCPWNNRNWEIGDMLLWNSFNLDDTDLTRDKWLAEHGIKLEAESEESINYRKDCPF